MEVVPRIFVRRGRIVWPLGPRQWEETIENRDEVLAHAQQLYKRHDILYVVDVDGLDHTHANLELYQALERRGVFPWLEAGYRRVEDVMDAFFAGADRVTVHLNDMPPEEFKDLTGITEGDVFLAVDLNRHGLAKWRARDIIDFVERAQADGVMLKADHEADAYRVTEIASQFRQAGVPVAVSPWPGTRPKVDANAVDYLVVDSEG